jgi:hypothetical protein
VPQYYLSPYHVVADGHVVSLASASPYSLTVRYRQRTLASGEMEVTAHVDGGSGRYGFQWALRQPDDPEAGLLRLGSGRSEPLSESDGSRRDISSVVLPGGAFNVLVNVKDRATGAFKQHQESVFGLPTLIERPPGPLPVG